jgi:hypothetical protein
MALKADSCSEVRPCLLQYPCPPLFLRGRTRRALSVTACKNYTNDVIASLICASDEVPRPGRLGGQAGTSGPPGRNSPVRHGDPPDAVGGLFLWRRRRTIAVGGLFLTRRQARVTVGVCYPSLNHAVKRKVGLRPFRASSATSCGRSGGPRLLWSCCLRRWPGRCGHTRLRPRPAGA